MGCLMEILFEVLLEGVLELVMYLYTKLVSIFIPEKVISEKTRKVVKVVAVVFCTIMICCLVCGIFLFLAPENSTEHTVGAYMTFIPLTVLGIQIVLGIALLVIKAIKKRG